MSQTEKLLDAEWLARILESQLFVRFARYSNPAGSVMVAVVLFASQDREQKNWRVAELGFSMDSGRPFVGELSTLPTIVYRQYLKNFVDWMTKHYDSGLLRRQAVYVSDNGIETLYPGVLYHLGQMSMLAQSTRQSFGRGYVLETLSERLRSLAEGFERQLLAQIKG